MLLALVDFDLMQHGTLWYYCVRYVISCGGLGLTMTSRTGPGLTGGYIFLFGRWGKWPSCVLFFTSQRNVFGCIPNTCSALCVMIILILKSSVNTSFIHLLKGIIRSKIFLVFYQLCDEKIMNNLILVDT